MTKTWNAAAFQHVTPEAVLARARTRDDVHAIVLDQVAAVERQIDHLEAKPDLVLTPEYFFVGGKGPNHIGVIPFPGPEIELIQKVAAKRGVLIAGNVYARDQLFPDRFMNTSFIVDRTGNVVLKAFRIHTNHSASPHDFLDEFIAKVGIEGAFPVVDTELGKLAILTSMELTYPEQVRALVFRGAEVILHTTSGGIVDRDIARARAIENEAYVISANAARRGAIHPSGEVGSCVVDWRGEVRAQLPQGVEGECVGAVDIDEMRAKRGDMDIEYKNRGPNYLARMRVEMFRDLYAKTSVFPPNRYRKGFAVADTNDMKNQADLFADARRNMGRLGIKTS